MTYNYLYIYSLAPADGSLNNVTPMASLIPPKIYFFFFVGGGGGSECTIYIDTFDFLYGGGNVNAKH